jgi:hypothetical protein
MLSEKVEGGREEGREVVCEHITNVLGFEENPITSSLHNCQKPAIERVGGGRSNASLDLWMLHLKTT